MKITAFIITLVMLVFALCGCASKNEQMGEIVYISFERGSGSVWGNQLVFMADKDTVYTMSYFPKQDGEYVTLNNIPMPAEKWEEIKETALKAIETMEPKKEPNFLTKLIKRLTSVYKLDGGEYFKLFVEYENGFVEYDWFKSDEAYNFETLMEQTCTLLGNSVEKS